MRRSIAAMVLFAGIMLAAARAGAENPPPSEALSAGIAAYNKGDFATAFRLLKGAADAGEAQAMINLAYMYTRGHGVTVDYAEAFRLARRSAEMGDAEGMNGLGYRYQYGTGTQPDLQKAVFWYCKSALGGNQRAMNNLGILFYNGWGVEKNVTEAMSLWAQSMALGNLNAQSSFGNTLLNNRDSTEADRERGLKLLTDAAQQGNIFAQNALRGMGRTGPFPPGIETQMLMRLEPQNPSPGRSKACGDFVA